MQTLEDLDLDLERRRPEDEGVGVVARWPEASPDGETRSENEVAEELRDEEEWSNVLGRWTHVLSPIASFTFLHLLPILIQKGLQKNDDQILKQWPTDTVTVTELRNSERNAWRKIPMALSIDGSQGRRREHKHGSERREWRGREKVSSFMLWWRRRTKNEDRERWWVVRR